LGAAVAEGFDAAVADGFAVGEPEGFIPGLDGSGLVASGDLVGAGLVGFKLGSGLEVGTGFGFTLGFGFGVGFATGLLGFTDGAGVGLTEGAGSGVEVGGGVTVGADDEPLLEEDWAVGSFTVGSVPLTFTTTSND
jgi:hypothetical protein